MANITVNGKSYYIPDQYAPKPKKAEEHGFFHNLLSDVGDAVTGIPSGLYQIGKAGVSDVGDVFDGGGFDSDLADIGRAIGTSYKQYYGPLFSGDFGKFARNVKDHPLNIILDAASLVTGGGAAAGKLGAKAAVGGSATGAKLAGLERVGNIGSVLPGFTRADVLTGSGIMGKYGKGVRLADDGTILAPKTPILRTRIPGLSHEAPLKFYENPVRRATQSAFESLLAKAETADRVVPLVGRGKYFGTSRRIGRKFDRDRNDFVAKDLAPSERFMRDERKLRKSEADALIPALGGWTPDEGAAFFNRRAQNVALPGEAPIGEDNLARLALRGRTLADPKVKAAYETAVSDPASRAGKALESARALSERNTQGLIELGLPAEKAAARARLEYETVTGRIAPDNFKGVTRTHIDTSRKNSVPTLKTSLKNDEPKLAQLEKNTGYNFGNSRDSPDLRVIADTAKGISKTKGTVRLARQILDGAGEIDIDDLHRFSDAYEAVDVSSPVWKRLMETADFMDGPVREFADNPEVVDAIVNVFRNNLLKTPSEGKVLVVSKPLLAQLAKESKATSKAVKNLIDKPTSMWRHLTLSLRPAWLVNNAVGQGLLLAMSAGPSGAARGLVQQLGKKGDLVDEFAPHITQGHGGFFATELGGKRGGKFGRTAERLNPATNMGRLNTILTDSAPRRALFLSKLRPLVKRVQKENPSLSFDEAARMILKNDNVADALAKEVVGDLVDFSNLTDAERRYVRRAIPFWSWISGITKRTGRIVTDQPWIANAGSAVSAIGLEATEDALGDVPSFLRGAIGLGERDGKYQRLATTQGLNPFATVGDVSKMGYGLVRGPRVWGSENPASSFNPIFRGLAEAVANRDFFSGQVVDRDGTMSPLAAYGKQLLNAIPEVNTGKKVWADTWGDLPDYETLYRPSWKQALAQFGGLPVRDLNVAVARKRAGYEKSGKRARLT